MPKNTIVHIVLVSRTCFTQGPFRPERNCMKSAAVLGDFDAAVVSYSEETTNEYAISK